MDLIPYRSSGPAYLGAGEVYVVGVSARMMIPEDRKGLVDID